MLTLNIFFSFHSFKSFSVFIFFFQCFAFNKSIFDVDDVPALSGSPTRRSRVIVIKTNRTSSNQIFCCICLDISYSYFYILHIVDEICCAASFGSAVASNCMSSSDGSSVAVEADLIVAVVVTMRWGTDVTSSWCLPMGGSLGSGSTSPGPERQRRASWAADSDHCTRRIDSSRTS